MSQLDEFLTIEPQLSDAERVIVDYAKNHTIRRVELASLGFSEFDMQHVTYLGFLTLTDKAGGKSWSYVDSATHRINYFGDKHTRILTAIANGQDDILEISHSLGVRSPNFLATLRFMIKNGAPLRFNRTYTKVTLLTKPEGL
jgi:hypothetical protein